MLSGRRRGVHALSFQGSLVVNVIGLVVCFRRQGGRARGVGLVHAAAPSGQGGPREGTKIMIPI
jgi:hypothetical protein